MSLAVVNSRAQVGLEAPPVTVEVHLSPGLPALNIVGLPEMEVKEAKDRVRSAILNAHFDFPARRITVNLAPADLPKEGGRFDLPMAIGILAASGQIPTGMLAQHEFVGELALSGELRAVRGALSVALAAAREQHALILPLANVDEASLIRRQTLLPAEHLLQVTAHLCGGKPLTAVNGSDRPVDPIVPGGPDLLDVKGQRQAKRALEIAAAGAHSLLLVGPPGTGKSLLAARLSGLLPPMSEPEAIETATLHSLAGLFSPAHWCRRPYRAPHHTASAVALVGGGSHPRPGEISLAHNGVLFLDELPEHDRHVLEVLREPIESGIVRIARAARSVEFPARFQLIAAMNPCPCGYAGDTSGRCRCTPAQVRQYQSKISGPLLDRLDMHVSVPALSRDVLLAGVDADADSSATVRARVLAARERQRERSGRANSALDNREVEQLCVLEDSGRQLLEQAIDRLGMSARAYHRVLKLARTIADLAGRETIATAHLAEAIQYRQLDRRPLP
ncbi:MAG: YifB family Mg chelatase-like AAA ATPase [Pseudomonadota bacterium]